MTKPRDLRDVLSTARERGWQVAERNNGNLEFTSPDGKKVVVPNRRYDGPRNFENLIHRMRAAGLNWLEDAAPRPAPGKAVEPWREEPRISFENTKAHKTTKRPYTFSPAGLGNLKRMPVAPGFGTTFHEARIKAAVSLREIGELVGGLHAAAIARWEGGDKEPNDVQYRILSDLFGWGTVDYRSHKVSQTEPPRMSARRRALGLEAEVERQRALQAKVFTPSTQKRYEGVAVATPEQVAIPEQVAVVEQVAIPEQVVVVPSRLETLPRPAEVQRQLLTIGIAYDAAWRAGHDAAQGEIEGLRAKLAEAEGKLSRMREALGL